jgi:hypothetical protein
MLWLEEWLSSAKVNACHALFLEEPQAAFRLFQFNNMRVTLDILMKAEFASIVALPEKMVIDHQVMISRADR